MDVNDTITITFSECCENHIGNQKIGKLASEGFTYQELYEINEDLEKIGVDSYLVNLGDYLPEEYGKVDAGVLVIRNGLQHFLEDPNELYKELKALNWDTKCKAYGRVVNKHARHNLCFSDKDQIANYEEGKGTVVDFKHLRCLSHVRTHLHYFLGDKAKSLLAEGNHYYDVSKCFINRHGDTERRIVIGIRLGHSFPLYFYWHLGKEQISQRIDFNLDGGDIYVMCEKACGNDWKKKKIVTLRHAAGFNIKE